MAGGRTLQVNLLIKLKQFRRIADCYEKGTSFLQ